MWRNMRLSLPKKAYAHQTMPTESPKGDGGNGSGNDDNAGNGDECNDNQPSRHVTTSPVKHRLTTPQSKVASEESDFGSPERRRGSLTPSPRIFKFMKNTPTGAQQNPWSCYMRTDNHLTKKNLPCKSPDFKSLLQEAEPSKFPRMQRLVLRPEGKANQIWGCVMATLLMYTATIFPFRLCFVELRVIYPVPAEDVAIPTDVGWDTFNLLVDILFVMDVVVNFFLPFVDDAGETVTRPEDIWVMYFRGWFWLDFFACIPPAFVFSIFGITDGANKSARFLRLHRVGRLLRLTRLFRVAKLLRFVRLMKFMNFNPLYNAFVALFGRSRIVSVMKFLCFLLLLVHTLGCGWYVVAFIEDNPEDTWLYRRSDRNLLDSDVTAVDQWLASLYFVLTVFTSVGFGDIFGVTRLEIVYVMMLQIIGAVVQSIIVSEMINVFTWVDEAQAELKKRKFMVTSFAQQAGLSGRQVLFLQNSVERTISDETTGRKNFDRYKMQDLLIRSVPRQLQNELIDWVFGGKLRHNEFFFVAPGLADDARLYMMACVHMTLRHYQKETVVYHFGSHAQFLFLVADGIFAYVSVPSATHGGMEILTRERNANKVRGKLGASPTLSSSATANWPLVTGKGDSPAPPKDKDMLTPHSLCCYGSYFGEWEMIYPVSRTSTVRAETNGELILLPRAAFVMLISEFPQFMDGLRSSTARRKRRIRAGMRRCVRATTFLDLAATAIQAQFRRNLARRNPRKIYMAKLRACSMMIGKGKLLAKLMTGKTETQECVSQVPSPVNSLTLGNTESRASLLGQDSQQLEGFDLNATIERDKTLPLPEEGAQSSRSPSTREASNLRKVYEDNRKLRADNVKIIGRVDAIRKEQKEMMRMLNQMYFYLMTEKR